METSPHNPTLAEIDHAHGADHSGHVRTYIRIFLALLVFTLIEYFYAHWFKDWFIVLVLGLMTWAVIKATLVGLYFMHLKYEGKWVYGMLVPAGILATIFVCALIPDVAMQPVTEINEPDDEGAAASAVAPRPTISELIPEAKAGDAAPEGAALTVGFALPLWTPPLLASYRLGLAIVAAAILLAAGLTLGFVPATPRHSRAGYDLGDRAFALGHFSLIERSGRTVTDADLADEVWVASFIFTRCPSSCPRIVETLRGLRAGRLKNAPVRFVSVSVDPEHDTSEVLADFAKSRGLDGMNWWFLTGDKARIYSLILEEFHLPVAPGAGGPEAVAHSDRLALVDRGNRVVGVFSSGDAEAIDALVDQAKRRGGLATPWVRALPAVNASLNATCGLLLAIGLAMILSGRWRAHAVCMISGTVVGALFLGCYLVYHYHVGSVPFRGTGGARFAYFTILISHTALAALGVVPLATMTLARALRRRFDAHARIARVTFPIWMYVSITGVVIYVMLYQLPIPAPASGV